MSATAFLNYCLERNVLRFGEFTLKSGRVSPYFFNAGLFDRSSDLVHLGRYYAQAIVQSGLVFDQLFGPAYKGIPLVAAVSIALYQDYGRDLPWSFNRKEVKDHGEGGQLVGAALQGRILIIDDVITAGTAIRESVAIIRSTGAEPVGVVVAMDREERGQGEHSALQDVEETLGLRAIPVARLTDLIEMLTEQSEKNAVKTPTASLDALRTYRARYGTTRQ